MPPLVLLALGIFSSLLPGGFSLKAAAMTTKYVHAGLSNTVVTESSVVALVLLDVLREEHHAPLLVLRLHACACLPAPPQGGPARGGGVCHLQTA